MTSDELKKRLKIFALRIIKLSESLPNNKTGNALGNQIIFRNFSGSKLSLSLSW